ncbi:Protein of unknown function DUF262 [Abditibacterium utsteinense]|uniref:GmrSD restriction endonucleases N-terminal domain-containing protein n=1 Tax=Abditibacterium utsteinense TaxID=1960156 RepID=A0A2S8SQP4_9BACT|nr:DUF262 domain-containing protein [Abditibacterium utsteinense]PQV63108.1 Protein of unknown function DUF262 [Abditibacterium utsteinense]
MQAKETIFLPFLNVKQQFHIPIYQRTYSWEREECLQLWNDIVRVALDAGTPAHFIGSVVYIKPGTAADLVTRPAKRLIIDGQQRLTTLTLLLCALRDAVQEAEAKGESTGVIAAQIQDEYLTNKYGENEDRWKILLTDKDRDSLL